LQRNVYQNLNTGRKNKYSYDHRNVSEQYFCIVSAGRGFPGFPVRNFSDFIFHNLLIVSYF